VRGLFITIEGPDGAGKSTQAQRLAGFLKDKGYPVISTREPGGTHIGEQIRGVLLNPQNKALDFKTEVLLYAACRAQLLKEVIIPALNGGKIVISDRFVDSSIAYQGYGRALNLKLVVEINDLVVDRYKPDLTILLDLPVKDGLARIVKTAKALDRLEQEDIEFHQRVYDGFKDLASRDKRFRVVPADREEDQIFNEILQYVEEKLAGLDYGS